MWLKTLRIKPREYLTKVGLSIASGSLRCAQPCIYLLEENHQEFCLVAQHFWIVKEQIDSLKSFNPFGYVPR